MGEVIQLFEYDERDRGFGDSFPVTEPIPLRRRKPSPVRLWLGLGATAAGWVLTRALRGASPRAW